MSDTITVTGNISEPDLRQINGGISVLTFRLASTHYTYDREKRGWVENGTNWYTVSAFRTLADHAFASIHRGQRIMVHGRLKLREWENGAGGHGFSADIEADSLGHDLRWGTSSFTRQQGRDSAATVPTDGSWSTAAAGDGETGAAPDVVGAAQRVDGDISPHEADGNAQRNGHADSDGNGDGGAGSAWQAPQLAMAGAPGPDQETPF